MADEPRQQPVAIRVTRPYGSPEEFLEHELETLTRTSITLIGAQPRPKGVILRFEVALTGGVQLLRGEGRVVGFKENALGDLPGLVLRFTRLDTKSKGLVDRAALIREARARAALQAAMGEDSLPPPSVPPASLMPTSIGPMSVMQEPPGVTRDRADTTVSSPPTRPAPITAPPAFYKQRGASEAPAPPQQGFGEGMFSAEDAPTAAETSTSPSLFDTSGSIPPAPPANARSGSGAPQASPPEENPAAFESIVEGTRSFSPADMAAASRPAPASSGRANIAPDPNREPVLERLRARAKALSPARLKALAPR